MFNILRLMIRGTLPVVLSACVSSGATARAHHTSDQVGAAEIASTSTTNAYDLIQRLRPNWLKPPTVGSVGSGIRSQVIVVYLDGQRLGDVQALRTLSTAGIQSMQWIDATRAATVLNEPGSEPIAGAIVIKTH